MTPIEVRDELKKIEAEIGPKCEISAFISPGIRGGAWFSIKPLPYPSKTEFSTSGFPSPTWEEGFAAIREMWAQRKTDHEANIIRDMSLAIVRITYDNGECTDAALRVEFQPEDIDHYGEQALTRANAMAEGAPFSIVTTTGGNNQGEGDD